MPNNDYLLNSLCFDLVGSLLNDQIPTFLRPTPAFWEGYVNRSWRQVEFGRDHPRFSSNGTLMLEGATINLCSYPCSLSHSSWIKGSSMVIQPDRIQGPNRNYKADRIVVSAATGNSAAQRIVKTFALGSNQDYTLTVCLRLADGRFGDNDYLEIGGSLNRVYLASVYNDRVGNYIPISISYKTPGTTPTQYDQMVTQNVTMTLNVERSVSIDWAYCQLEPGTIATSFVQQESGAIQSRAPDFLQYPYSPIAGLNAFVVYCNLAGWKGNGLIAEAGNVRIEIFQGKLRATVGATTCTAPANLPNAAQICVRLSKGLERLRLYVNQVLVAEQSIASFTATQAPLTIGGEGVRHIGCLYFFNSDLSDGGLTAIGGTIASDLLLLHQQDSLMPELPEGYGMTVLPAVRIPAGGSVDIKFPVVQSARQEISSVAIGSGAVAQVDRLIVQSTPATGTDIWVGINDQRFVYRMDATPTPAEAAAGLAGMINALPKRVPVTAAYTAGNNYIMLNADAAGDPFVCTVSGELSRVTTTGDLGAIHTIVVPNAVDYVAGSIAHIFRNYILVAEVVLLTVNPGTGQITVRSFPNSKINNVRVGDVLIQPSWQLRLGRNVYFAHDLEDHPDVRVNRKSIDTFTLKNVGAVDRITTPYFKVAL